MLHAMSDIAEQLKGKLRADLLVAMRARDDAATATLRQLLAALDDAQAVPVETARSRYEVRRFGGPGVEVPRVALDAAAIIRLLAREAAVREDAAMQLDRHGRPDAAATMRAAAALIRSYADG